MRREAGKIVSPSILWFFCVRRGVANTSVFVHKDLDVVTVIHGYNYVSSGPPDGLTKLEHAFEEKFE